ncbi:MAG: phenylacetate--CoA ligase family protein [Deltaproteobacteria bacterium]|nr:phenylacetate--CoA ligase family protein [Deltaproteobacteria bacterium]
MTLPPSDARYWNAEMEGMLGTEPMRRLQLERLRQRVAQLWEHAPYFRRRMEQRGARPGDVNSLEDWARVMPVFTKGDYRDLIEACENDVYRLLDETLPVPLDQLVTMAATSGTTGDPQPYPLTWQDIDALWGEFVARARWRCGVRRGDRVVHAFALSMFLAGVPILQCLRDGVLQIPVGAESGVARILKTARFFKGNVLMCTPSLAEHLIERAPEILGAPVDSLGIKILMCGGEPGAGIPEVRRRIESAYGGKLYDLGAGLGVSCDWPEYPGMHWIGDDLVIYELVSPATHEPIPLVDGAEGEAVFTSLIGGGFGWTRLSLGDIHRVTVSPCACGATGLRYRIVGRVDDMLKVKGVIVYPAAIDSVISGFIPRVTGEFRIRLDEKPPRVVPPLKLRIERGADTARVALSALEAEIERAMHERLKFTPRITWLEPGELPRSEHKTRFIEIVPPGDDADDPAAPR